MTSFLDNPVWQQRIFEQIKSNVAHTLCEANTPGAAKLFGKLAPKSIIAPNNEVIPYELKHPVKDIRLLWRELNGPGIQSALIEAIDNAAWSEACLDV
jgi:hypothetical protein